MEIKIEKFDNEGRGIGYINNKIIFVPKTLPGDIVEIDIVKDNKKYYEGKVIKIVKSSDMRIEPKCRYFGNCGACNLLNLEYKYTIKYKEDKIREIFKKFLDINIDNMTMVDCGNTTNYRNKITLHIKNNILGLVDEDNDIIQVDECLMISDSMNEAINFVKSLNVENGLVVIRENYNDEILVSIKTLEKLIINDIPLSIIGIIINDEVYYGKSYFIEEINNLKFKVSYNSFFQINNCITKKLFDIIANNVTGQNVVDLYCGVGTLGIVASSKAKKVLGIDNLKSNIDDANENKIINKINNIDFICEDASFFNNKIKFVDTVIVDPARKGLNKDTIKNILQFLPSKIIYVSCNPFSLVRDLKELLNNYDIRKSYFLDMFPYTHHIESLIILERK